MFDAIVTTTKATFEPTYPVGVKGFHSTLVQAIFPLFLCKQAVTMGRVLPDLQLAALATLVDKLNESSGDSYFFVHELFVNDQALAKELRDQLGINVTTMQSVTVTSPTPRVIEYSIPPDRTGYTVRTSSDIDEEGGSAEERHAFVFGDRKTVAMYGYRGHTTMAAPGVIEAAESSYWGRHSPVGFTQETLQHGTGLTFELSFQS